MTLRRGGQGGENETTIANHVLGFVSLPARHCSSRAGLLCMLGRARRQAECFGILNRARFSFFPGFSQERAGAHSSPPIFSLPPGKGIQPWDTADPPPSARSTLCMYSRLSPPFAHPACDIPGGWAGEMLSRSQNWFHTAHDMLQIAYGSVNIRHPPTLSTDREWFRREGMLRPQTVPRSAASSTPGPASCKVGSAPTAPSIMSDSAWPSILPRSSNNLRLDVVPPQTEGSLSVSRRMHTREKKN